MIVKCDACSYTTRTNSAIRVHKFRVHSGPKPWRCEYPGCSRRFNDTSALKKHGVIHETVLELRRPFQCPVDECEFRSARKLDLKRHVTARHTPKRTRDFQCPMCPSRFFTKESLRLHLPRHTREEVFKCSQCDYGTHVNYDLNAHVKRVHKESGISKCPFPGCTFSTIWKNSLRKHEETHNPHRPKIQCRFPDCAFITISEGSMKQHIRSRHGKGTAKKHICPLCTKSLVTIQSLTAHINHIHTKEKHYKCEQCQYVAKSEGCLRVHRQRMHKDDYFGKYRTKWLYCKLCPLRVRQKSQLRLHEKNVHGEEREFKCPAPDCKYETNYIFSFNNHVLCHEEDPEKRFPFACTFPGCDFRRTSKYRMASHELQHETSGLQLECKFCPGRCYPDGPSLFFHDCIAHNRKRHKCPRCNFAASKKSNWIKHMRRIHNLEAGRPYGLRKTTDMGHCTALMSTNNGIPVVLLERIDVKVPVSE